MQEKTIERLVVTGFVWVNGKFLVQEHIKSGTYSLPMGKVEVGEECKDAFIREVAEELNAVPINLIEIGASEYNGIKTVTFFCGLKDGFYENREPDKCAKIHELFYDELVNRELIVNDGETAQFSGLSNATKCSINTLRRTLYISTDGAILAAELPLTPDKRPMGISGLGWTKYHHPSEELYNKYSALEFNDLTYNDVKELILSGDINGVRKLIAAKIININDTVLFPMLSFMFDVVMVKNDTMVTYIVTKPRIFGVGK